MNVSETAIILCGGKGERLRPLTSATPKPLICINKRPILSYIINRLFQFNIKNIVIAAGYLSDRIEEYINSNYDRSSVKIVSSGEVDIIERIKLASEYCPGNFMVLYGDTISDVDFDSLRRFHSESQSKSTVTLYPLKTDFGIADVDNESNVVRFREKPILEQWINIGNFYYDRSILPEMALFKSYAEFLVYIAEKRLLKAYLHRGLHITVNTLQELEDAEKNLKIIGEGVFK